MITTKKMSTVMIEKTHPYTFVIIGFLFFSLIAVSCGDSDNKVPSDLNLTITVVGADQSNPNGDGTGRINCVATANDAVRYEYSFDGGDPQESTDGTTEHTFSKSGTNSYSVLVFAYSSSGAVINTTQFITVFQSNSARTLIFSEEFDVDGAVDSDTWTAEINPPNNGSWWNGEKQHYTNRTDNAYVSDNTLKIVAKKEPYTFAGSTKNYTSARLLSKFSFTYGRIDVRAKLPTGEGTWPAIWTLGSNITSVGWPTCGEIDIMEHWGHNPTKVASAIHTLACSGGCSDVTVGSRNITDYDTNFHIYSAEWTPESIDFYIDDEFLYSYNPTTKTPDNWPFTANQFIILNVAMGGDWFNIDPNFTQSVMEVDYVRVYQ